MNSVMSAKVAAISNVLTAIRTGERAIRAAERAVEAARSEDKYIARMHLAMVEKRTARRVAAATAVKCKVLGTNV